MADSYPRGGFLTSRQMSHAIGVSVVQLHHMRKEGEATPTYQLPTPSGGNGEYLWTADEVRRILALSDRRTFRRRRKARTKMPLNGLVPVQPKVRIKRTFPAPP